MAQLMGCADRMFGSHSPPALRREGISKVSDISLPSNLRRRSFSPPLSSMQAEKAFSPSTPDLGAGRDSLTENPRLLGTRKRRSGIGQCNSSMGEILSSPSRQVPLTPRVKSLISSGFEGRRSADALQRVPAASLLASENSPNPKSSRGQLKQLGDVDAHSGTIRCYRDSQHSVTNTALRTGSPGLPWEGQHRPVGVDGSGCGHTSLAQRAHGGPKGDLGPGGEKRETNSDSRWALPGPSPSSNVASPKTRPAATGPRPVAPYSYDTPGTPVPSSAREKVHASPATPSSKCRTGDEFPTPSKSRTGEKSILGSPIGSSPCRASEYQAQNSYVHRSARLSNLGESDWGNHFQRRERANNASLSLGNTPRVSVSGRVGSPQPAWRI